MRIIWSENKFQAELAQGEKWREEMELVRGLGFKTSGPPNWTWTTGRASIVEKLKGKCSMSADAFKQFQIISDVEKKVLEAKKALKKADKEAKKASLDPKISGLVTLEIPAKGYIEASDLPASTQMFEIYKPPAPPKSTCMICDEPVYLYEKETICLWCEKELDND